MTVLTPYGQEIGAKYVMRAPDGSVCTFNEPAGENYVGPLSVVTGLDSPEVIESFGMNVERDGGFDNNYQLGRRPFTLQGQIVPTSTSDRLFKIAYLNAASLALRESGKLEWKASNGAELFLNFRRQAPVVTSEAWVKNFFLSCVAADPRIYSKESNQQYLAVNGNIAEDNIYKFTFVSGSPTVTSVAITVVNGQPLRFLMWMRVNSTWTGGIPKLGVEGVTGTQEMTGPFTLTEKGTWKLISLKFTPTASGTGSFFVTSTSIPTAGNSIEFNMPMIESADFSGALGSSESLAIATGATWTKSNVFERPPYNVFEQGNYPSPVVATIYGPITGFKLVNTQSGEPLVQVTGLTLVKGEKLVIDLDKRTATIEPSGKDAYGLVNFLNTTWWGIASGLVGSQTVKLTSVTGAGESTGAIIKYRNVWV